MWATRHKQFLDVAQKVNRGREQISTVGDAGIELVLARRCGDVCKVIRM